jgi:hypothetical protein
MSDGGLTLAERFRSGVVSHLEPLTDQLIPVLRRLVEYPYPPEVAYLDFEVFCDGFTQEFPVRAFFMDATACEFFVYSGSQAEYPCDVDPQILQLDRVYPLEFEEPFLAADDELDVFTLAGEALIPWFVRCWAAAGGTRFGRGAQIGLHDSFRRFDLVRQVWGEE